MWENNLKKRLVTRMCIGGASLITQTVNNPPANAGETG